MTRLARRRLGSAAPVLLPALLALVVSALVACGGGGGGEAEGEAPTDETAAAAPANGEEQPPPEPDAKAEADESEAEAKPSPTAELPRRNVQVYFPASGGDGLVTEWREIFNTATPGDRVKQIVADLISGPTSGKALRAVPAGTQLRQAFVLDDGVAYLDFSSELTEGTAGGSEAELLTVYAIVDSVVRNVPEVRRVGILVNGRSLETLNGHVDLRRALPPNYALVLDKGSARLDGDGSRVESLASSATGSGGAAERAR